MYRVSFFFKVWQAPYAQTTHNKNIRQINRNDDKKLKYKIKCHYMAKKGKLAYETKFLSMEHITLNIISIENCM